MLLLLKTNRKYFSYRHRIQQQQFFIWFGEIDFIQHVFKRPISEKNLSYASKFNNPFPTKILVIQNVNASFLFNKLFKNIKTFNSSFSIKKTIVTLVFFNWIRDAALIFSEENEKKNSEVILYTLHNTPAINHS